MYYSDFFESGINNYSAQNSVHLSPEELAAIDHGIMSAYGNRSNPNQNTPYNQNPNQNQNQNQNQNIPPYNTPYNSTPFMNDYFKTPTPASSQNGNVPFSYTSTPYNSTTYNANTPYNASANTNTNNMNNMNSTPHFGPSPPQSHKNSGSVDENVIKSYENRIHMILQDERERFEKMEEHYRKELDYLKKNDLGYSERLKLEQVIQELRNKIERLERDRRNTNSNSDVSLKQHYDTKISNLIKQFEQEKSSALDIMKTRAKSEINLLIPKIKAQVIQSMERAQADKMDKFKAQVGGYIKKLKGDWQAEREILMERMERRHAEEIKNIQNQMQIKYEMKLQEEKKKMMFDNQKSHQYHNNINGNSNNNNRYSNDYDTRGYSSFNTPSYGNRYNTTPYNNNDNNNNQLPNSSFFESSFLL